MYFEAHLDYNSVWETKIQREYRENRWKFDSEDLCLWVHGHEKIHPLNWKRIKWIIHTLIKWWTRTIKTKMIISFINLVQK